MSGALRGLVAVALGALAIFGGYLISCGCYAVVLRRPFTHGVIECFAGTCMLAAILFVCGMSIALAYQIGCKIMSIFGWES